MKLEYKSLALAALLALTSFAFAPTASAASTVVVTGDTSAGENQPGWMFNRDVTTSTPFEFNTDQASIGMGSLYVEPITNSLNTRFDKFIAEYFYLGSLEDFESISYDFMIGAGGTLADANDFYLNAYTNLPTQSINNFYDCRFDFVPTTGSLANFETFTVDKNSTATNVQSRNSAPCPASGSSLNDLPSGSTIRVFAINVGDTSASDTGLDGYLDNVVVTVSGDATTYDFEPALTPTTKDECKNGGWMSFNSPFFKNQGDCVSFVASQGKANGNPIISFFLSLFG